jgi:hypothetical protein
MQYGTPGLIRREIDLESEYTVVSPNLIVCNPDGTVNTTIVPTVSPLSSTPASSFCFTSLFVPTMAGLHSATLQFLYNGVTTYNFPFTFFAAWTNLHEEVRKLIKASKRQLTDSTIDSNYSDVLSLLYSYCNSALPNYWQFNASYQANFERAAKFLVAARCRLIVSGKTPAGELVQFSKGTTKLQWANGPQQEFTIERIWENQAWEIFDATIPELANAYDTDRPGDEIATRGDLAIGNWHARGRWPVGSGQGQLYPLPWWTGDGGVDDAL